ncbi:ParA family protein [Vibrio genomosp. F6]|uniref:ParA family protein n=1 Tax=Vibrio genomosp. F6 TaxID=723172 RepID=UPI0010BDCF82|nr:ParA family protein [Vibrio genomosp. F6]TKF23247.1 ParA family protein [Vibrio genomosp. F6]
MVNDKKSTSCKAIAIVSGKGGSGKTMVAATMATILDSLGHKVLLIDADYGTAGLTYYMGLNTVANISVGLTNLSSLEKLTTESLNRYSQSMKGFENSDFIGVGDHRRYLKSSSNTDVGTLFERLIEKGKEKYDFILIDCRGGIDTESLMVCTAADDIVIVAETDTTSFQATQFLVDTLYDNNMSDKLSGFMINKVFDDPSSIARAGTASFKSQYLDSVPFDLDATKSFLVGDLPARASMFSSQIWHVIYKLYPEVITKPNLRSLNFKDYRGLSLRDNDSLIGGMMISFISLALGSAIFYDQMSIFNFEKVTIQSSIALLVVLSVFSGIEPARRAIGRVFSTYRKLVLRVFSGSSR